MNGRGRPSDPRKPQAKLVDGLNSMQSQAAGFNFIKDKKPAAIRPPQSYEYELPEREREIRLAIEMRFSKSKMNKDYEYRCDDDTPSSSRDSTHSSQMEEYRHLKGARIVDLNEQNPKKKAMEKYESLKGRLGRFKFPNSNNSAIRKTEGDQMEQKGVRSNEKMFSKNDSPVNIMSKYLFKPHKPQKRKEKQRKVNISEESDKYRTLGAPYLQKSKQYVRYTHHQKLIKSKEQLSRDSSSSENSHLLRSNMTLQVEFKKKLNGNNTSVHFKNVSSSTRLGSVPKVPVSQEKSRSKVVSTSSGKLHKTNDKLLRILFNGKRL